VVSYQKGVAKLQKKIKMSLKKKNVCIFALANGEAENQAE
jgi:hypothetical protein